MYNKKMSLSFNKLVIAVSRTHITDCICRPVLPPKHSPNVTYADQAAKGKNVPAQKRQYFDCRTTCCTTNDVTS